MDYVVPSRPSRSSNLLKDGLLVLGFSLFLALCAQISINLPFTPVPITLQTLGALLTGAALGSKRRALAMLVYLAEDAAGLPVFAGGMGGFIHLAGFTPVISGPSPLLHLLPGFFANVDSIVAI